MSPFRKKFSGMSMNPAWDKQNPFTGKSLLSLLVLEDGGSY
jgi:hypothetical protein